MQLRAVLIDPARQKISQLRIPQSPSKQRVSNSLSRLIGCATMKFAWISHRTKVAFGTSLSCPAALSKIRDRVQG